MSFFHIITYNARPDKKGAPIVIISVQRFDTLTNALGYARMINREYPNKHAHRITTETFEFLDYKHNSLLWTKTRGSYLSKTGQVNFDNYQIEEL